MPRHKFGCVAVALVSVLVSGLATTVVAPAVVFAAVSCDLTWAGPANGVWSVAKNWSPHGVPTMSTDVCVTTATGPRVPAGTSAVANNLTVTDSTLHIDGAVTPNAFVIDSSDLSGSGNLVANGSVLVDNELTGVLVSGSLTIGPGSVHISGSRVMCGHPMALCLNGTSQLAVPTQEVYLDSGLIGGASTAVPAVEADMLLVTGQGDRISVDTDTIHGVSGSIQLDRWEQLSADGTLTGNVNGGTVAVARPVLTLDSTISGNVTVIGTHRNAFTTLTTVGSNAGGQPQLPATVRPQGGVLTVEHSNTGEVDLTSFNTVTTVVGALHDSGRVVTYGELHANSYTHDSTQNASFEAPLYAPTVTVSAGSVTFAADVFASTVAVHGGSVLVDGAHTLAGALTFDGRGVLSADGCTDFSNSLVMGAHTRINPIMITQLSGCAAMINLPGTFTLPPTLAIRNVSRPVLPLGTRIVLVDAAGAITGTFSTITGQNVGPNHWDITYTATEVVATLVAGNV